MGSPATRQELKTELEAARLEFHALVRSLSERDLRRPSLNPGWSNREILFHMTLGFLLIPILLRLVRLFNRVPPGYSTGFAKALNASTPAFNA